MEIYDKYTFWPFGQVLATSFLNPWNILSDKSNGSIFCYNIWFLVLSSWNQSHKGEMDVLLLITSPFQLQQFMLMRWLLKTPEDDRAGCQGNQPRIESWNLFPSPDFPGGKRGWRLNQSPMASELINHVYIMKPPWKSQKKGFKGFPCWETRALLGATVLGPHSMGTEAPLFSPLPCVSLLSGCWYVSSNILCNKLAI